VVLPDPSRPSKVTNTAARTIRRMRAVVTGGAGFIGSHVVDALLARGDEVHVLDDFSRGKRENVGESVRVHAADIRTDSARVFDEVRPEVCFHLAAQADVRVSVERPDFDADVNVVGTLHVLEAAREHGTKIVFSSTGGAIYGECEGPAREDHQRAPLAPYGVSKLAGEEYIAAYNRLYGTGHVSLRFGNVYGPRQDPKGEAGVVAIFMNRLREGEAPKIFGNGTQTRDYVYVGDVVAATLAAAGHAGGVLNVGTGVETSVLDLYERIQRAAGVEREPEFAETRPGELQRSVLDASLAQRELGWEPQHSLDDGLAETWAWIRDTS
jgi:UDP-glucose 4-epimerase